MKNPESVVPIEQDKTQGQQYDAVQLAAALEIHVERQKVNAQPITLVSADDALNPAASREDLIVDNPNLHP